MMNNDGGRELYCWKGGGGAGGICKASLVRDVPVRPLNPDPDFF